MSIWIPRSTSGFTSSDGSIKIDGACYKAIQKNVSKDQAPSAETYNQGTHGDLGEKFDDCTDCQTTESGWGAVFWLNEHCGDGYSIPGFGDWMGDFVESGNWDYSNSASAEYYSPGVPDFLTELVSRKTSLERIEENPTSATFASEFNIKAPNDSTSNYYDWQTSATCISSEGAVASTWILFFLYPDGMYDTFQQNSANISVDSTPTFDWNGVNYKISRIAQNQSSGASVSNLSFSKS
tara:strand:- start:1514 stop:2227 length:714 start_codon:yes stop_codon:yes gene_type:complete